MQDYLCYSSAKWTLLSQALIRSRGFAPLCTPVDHLRQSYKHSQEVLKPTLFGDRSISSFEDLIPQDYPPPPSVLQPLLEIFRRGTVVAETPARE